MKGVPLRLELGPKDLEQKQVTLSKRYNGEKITLPLDQVAGKVPALLEEIQEAMYQKALVFLNSHIVECRDYEEAKKVITSGMGFAKMMVKSTNEAAIEAKFKQELNATPRVMPFDQRPFQSKDTVTGEEGADTVVYFARAY